MPHRPALVRHCPAHNHGAAQAEGLEDAGQRLAQVRARHADQRRRRLRRVQQRAEEVEDGALAALGAELARRDDVLEGWMVFRRKEESEAVFPQ